MMNREPRSETVLLGTGYGDCSVYSCNAFFDGRKLIPGTEVFHIGHKFLADIYFEGRPEEGGQIRWTRKATGERAHITGTWNRSTGQCQIVLDTPLGPSEEITLTYKWQPHYLTGAEVMVRLNNEERFVPIEDLQAALNSYLKQD